MKIFKSLYVKYMVTLCAFSLLIIDCVNGYKDENEKEGYGHDKTEQSDKNTPYKRYVVETDYLHPVFGSYKYNPVIGTFDLPYDVHSSTTKIPVQSWTSDFTRDFTPDDVEGSSRRNILRTENFIHHERSSRNKLPFSNDKKTKEIAVPPQMDFTKETILHQFTS